MSSNPLFFMGLGLVCMLGPAFLIANGEEAMGGSDSAPTRIATVHAQKDACLRETVEMAGGGRVGCTDLAYDGRAGKGTPIRRTDTTGAVFVSVGK
ncbi:MAG: hypothetical protein AAGH70_02915 [Pseudomonadota bacterium]